MKKYKNLSEDQRGITNHLVITAIAVFVLSVIGFAGYRIQNNNDVKAKAAGSGYTYIVGDLKYPNHPSLQACKTQVNSPYGALWKVKLIFNNPSKSGTKYATEFYVERGKNLVSTTSFALMGPGNSVTKEAFASILLNDTYSTSGGNGNRGGGGPFAQQFSFSTITGC